MAQINQQSTPSGSISNPASGSVALFSEPTDSGRLYLKDYQGNVYPAVSGSGGGSGLIPIQNDGVAAGNASTLNFSGSAVDSIAVAGGIATIGLSGGGGGGAGSSGTSGAAGVIGTSGTSGAAGAIGTSGTAGADGTSGTSGAAGAVGTSGTAGGVGSSGTSGAAGVIGTSGTSGAAGAVGTSGTTGTSGAAGAPGTSGTTGTSGAAGAVGTSGTTGTSGAAGAPGTSGTAGGGQAVQILDESISKTTDVSSINFTGTGVTATNSGDAVTVTIPGGGGGAGSSGTSGSGAAGTAGTSGAAGAVGTSGTSGAAGAVGTSGTSGAAGAVGTSGTAGGVGTSGTAGGVGSSGTSGAAGVIGTSGTTGTSGAAGAAGTSGTSASGGGGGTPYTNVVRYEVASGSDKAQLMSSGNTISGLSWARTTTTVTITSTSHGLTTGDYVVLRNFNVDYVYAEITVSSVNIFTVQVANSGDTSGTAGVYIPAFDVSALSETALTIVAPSAGNCQLMSVQVFINSSDTGTITVTLPNNAIENGAGGNNTLDNRNPPQAAFYNVGGSNSSQINAGGVSFSMSSNHNVYTLAGGLDLFGSLLYTLHF